LFCGRHQVRALSVRELFEYMAGCLRKKWGDPNDEVGWSSTDGGCVGAEVIDSWELLERLDQPLRNGELARLFAVSFDVGGVTVTRTRWRRTSDNHRLLKHLGAGATLWRGRSHSADETPGDAGSLGSPPIEHTKSLRMGPAGISVFYASDDIRTTLAEVQPSLNTSRSPFGTPHETSYLDLAELDPVPSVFDMTAGIERPWLRFLHRFRLAWSPASE
jgi:hypothetical protein